VSLKPWSDTEQKPSPDLKPETWAKVEGFLELYRDNPEAIRTALGLVGKYNSLDDCEWSFMDYHFLYVKIQFFSGINTPCTLAATLNNTNYLLTINEWEHSYPHLKPEAIYLGNYIYQLGPVQF